jgi:dienelactone hydrolase
VNGLLKLQPDCVGAEMAQATDRSIKSNLERQRTQLQERLSKINAALDALNKQPEVAELLESIIKVM